jgi:two-component system NtrC family sensor kinase
VPLRAKGITLGTMVGAMRSPRQFETEELDLLSTIGSQIGMAIENASCYQQANIAAEQALASERRYREIFENAHDAIWVHDLEGNIITANKAAQELTGYSVKEAKDMNVKSFLTEESLALAGQIRQHLFAGEKVEQPYEQRIMRKDGTQATVKLATSIVTEEGKIIGFQNIARDVTRELEMQNQLKTAYSKLSESHERLKESQEQLIQAEKLTSLGQLAASIAHEVNNPLSGILTYNQLLAKKIKNDTVEKEVALSYLAKMEAELIRSTKLIRNLLDFARQSPPAFRQVNLNDIVNRAYDLTAHSAQLQHVEETKELDPSLPNFMADFDQLQQVCTNLILNAIQAMPKGGKLDISTGITDGQIRLAVRDTGVGISPENMHKLFTPFFTTKREVKGVGLGLAVSYGIIQRHHGRIDVQSKEGEGTTFNIFLPLDGDKHIEKIEERR